MKTIHVKDMITPAPTKDDFVITITPKEGFGAGSISNEEWMFLQKKLAELSVSTRFRFFITEFHVVGNTYGIFNFKPI